MCAKTTAISSLTTLELGAMMTDYNVENGLLCVKYQNTPRMGYFYPIQQEFSSEQLVPARMNFFTTFAQTEEKAPGAVKY